MPSAPDLQRMVEKLRDRGVQSVYLDRLRARVDSAQAVSDLQQEIAQEIARSLGRSEDRVNLALLGLALCDRQIREADFAHVARQQRQELVERFNTLRAQALSRRRDLQIHREAVGLRRNGVLTELYPVPARCVLDD